MAVAISGDKLADLGEDFRIVERLEIDKDQEDRQKEPGVADAIDDKGLRRCLGRRHLVIVVADQEIGAETDAFPADEEHRVVVAHHQQQHRDHEEVHVREEARESLFTVHVADRIDVDEEAYSRHHEEHDAGERIHEEGHVDREIPAENPRVGDDFARRSTVQDVAKHADGAEERQANRSPRQTVSPLVRPEIAAEDAVGDDGEQREDGNQLDQEISHVSLRHLLTISRDSSRRHSWKFSHGRRR